MSANTLLENVTADSIGREVSLRVVGARNPPAKMTVQIQVTGSASVQIQGRIDKQAEWADLGDAYSASALTYLEPIPFLRAVASKMGESAAVSVWAAWNWM